MVTVKKSMVFKPKARTNKWKKGQSCLSNPSCTKHRSAANLGPSISISSGRNLTFEALQKHDDLDAFSDKLSLKDADELQLDNVSAASSHVSVCTNVTFANVIERYASSNLPEHKELISTLEGMAEVLKSKGEKGSDLQYVAMLSTLLKSNKVNSCKQVEAILFLLNLSIKRVPQSVLRVKYGELSKVVMDVVAQHCDEASQSFVKSAVSILCFLLRSLSASSWEDSSTKHSFYCLLCMIASPKPKVRKATQQGVASVLRASCFMLDPHPPPSHPATHDTAVFCINKLEEYRKGGDVNATLYVASFLGDVVGLFNKTDLKSSCEILLKLFSISDAMMKVVCLASLRKMFSMRPSSHCLPPQLNAQIISAVFEHRPSEEDTSTTSPWLQLLAKAYSNLSRLDASMYLQNLPRLFETCLKCLKSNLKLVSPALETLLTSINDCNHEVIACAKKDDTVLSKLCRKLEHALSYQFMTVWQHVLAVITRLVEFFGRSYPKSFKSLLLALNFLRETPNFPHEELINRVFGVCVRILGASVVLDAVPLCISATEEDDLSFKRSWLLPVIRDNARETELSFFIDHFIPLANSITNRCKALEANSEKAALKAYQLIRYQIWSLLPAFCTSPTDLVVAFPRIAQLLGGMMSSNEEVRLHILNAVRKLVSLNIDKEAEKAVLARFSKNFLPLLCNLYTSTKGQPPPEQPLLPLPHNLALLDTFKCYLCISDQPVIDNCVTVCFKKVKGELTPLQRRLLMDLMVALVKHMRKEHLKEVLEYSLQKIKEKDKIEQKKNYRVLEEICKVIDGFEAMSLVQPLSHQVSQSSPVAKAPRLRCLRLIVKKLPERDDEFYKSIIPEAVLCTKAVGSKARLAAFGLVQQLATSYVHHLDEKFPKQALMNFLSMLLPGLTSSDHTIACTLLAVSKVIYELKDDLTEEVLKGTLESVSLLMKSQHRPVVEACLVFIKTLTSACKTSIQHYLRSIMTSLELMDEDQLHHFRFKIKEIYTKLSRIVGIHVLLPLVPVCHHRMVVNMRKKEDKKKKNNKDEHEEDEDGGMSVTTRTKTIKTGIDDILRGIDTDDEEDDEDDYVENDDSKSRKTSKSRRTTKSRQGGKKKGGRGDVYLKEDGDIIDLLDPAASKQIFTSKPEKKRKEADTPFKTLPDGRIIITDDAVPEKKKKTEIETAVDMIDVVDFKNRKRKMSMRKDDYDEDDEDNDGASVHTKKSHLSYKSGGTGIHRSLKKQKKKKMSNEETGAKFKSKKAKGDVKKGSVDPYAYYPLNPSTINKRSKRKILKIVKKE